LGGRLLRMTVWPDSASAFYRIRGNTCHSEGALAVEPRRRTRLCSATEESLSARAEPRPGNAREAREGKDPAADRKDSSVGARGPRERRASRGAFLRVRMTGLVEFAMSSRGGGPTAVRRRWRG
jgi:hypothetical protein